MLFRTTATALALFLSLAAAGGAQAGNPDDQAAIERGQKAVAWISAYDCPHPATPMHVNGLATPADISRVRDENWAFATGLLEKQKTAIEARNVVAGELAAAGSHPTAGLKASFAELDDT